MLEQGNRHSPVFDGANLDFSGDTLALFANLEELVFQHHELLGVHVVEGHDDLEHGRLEVNERTLLSRSIQNKYLAFGSLGAVE